LCGYIPDKLSRMNRFTHIIQCYKITYTNVVLSVFLGSKIIEKYLADMINYFMLRTVHFKHKYI